MKWTDILDKYGWPALILFVVALFFWKALWPMIRSWVERTEKRADEAALLVRDQIATQAAAALRSEARTAKLTDEFLATNNKLSDANDQTVAELRKISGALAKFNRKR